MALVLIKPQENTDLWHAADSLSLLTESLYEAWVLQPERRRDAESMKEAGLGVASASAAVATATSAAPTAAALQVDGAGAGAAATTTAEMTASSRVEVREKLISACAGREPFHRSCRGNILLIQRERERERPASAWTDWSGVFILEGFGKLGIS